MALILLDSGTIIGFLDVDDAFHAVADATQPGDDRLIDAARREGFPVVDLEALS